MGPIDKDDVADQRGQIDARITTLLSSFGELAAIYLPRARITNVMFVPGRTNPIIAKKPTVGKILHSLCDVSHHIWKLLAKPDTGNGTSELFIREFDRRSGIYSKATNQSQNAEHGNLQKPWRHKPNETKLRCGEREAGCCGLEDSSHVKTEPDAG